MRADAPVVLFAVVAAMLGCAVQALLSPPLYTADETAHLDYAVQVWHGHLPVFEAGVTIVPGFGAVPPVQWVSQHPPLYYVLLAPVVGPLVDGGHMLAAVYAGRAVGALLAAALVVAAATAARWAFPGRAGAAGLTALVVAANPWMRAVGGSVYNDLLAAIFATLMLGLAARTLREGLTARRAVGLAILATAALASRASTLVVVVAAVATVLVVEIARLAALPGAARRRGPAVLLGVGSPVLAMAGIGWFYLRNERLTGSFTGGQPDWAAENLNRHPVSLIDLLTTPGKLVSLLAVYSYGEFRLEWAVFGLLGLPALFLVVRWWRRRHRHRTDGDGRSRGDVSVVVCLALATVGTYGLQLGYGAEGGGLQARYMLAVILPLALVVAHGLLAIGRAWPVLALVWIVATAAEQVAWLVDGLGTFSRGAWPHTAASPTAAVVCTVLSVAALLGGLAVLARNGRGGSPAVGAERRDPVALQG